MVSCFASVMLMKLMLGLLKASWWSRTNPPPALYAFLSSSSVIPFCQQGGGVLNTGWRGHVCSAAAQSGLSGCISLGFFFISAQILLAGWLKKSTIVCLCVLSFSSSSARVSYRSRTFKKIYFIKMHSTIVCTKLIHSQKDERCNLF